MVVGGRDRRSAGASCRRGEPLLALLGGLALIAGTLGWLLPLPVHHRVGLCAGAARGHRHAPARAARGCDRRLAGMARCRRRGANAPRLAAILFSAWRRPAAWLPTMQHDDLAYHLGLPWQLMLNGRYALDPSHQVWAFAPWAGDVLQAVPQLLARTEARSALNALWFAATAAGLWRLGSILGLAPMLRWTTLALFGELAIGRCPARRHADRTARDGDHRRAGGAGPRRPGAPARASVRRCACVRTACAR